MSRESSHLQVLKSPAGYYIGRVINEMPFSRESGYFKTKEEATTALQFGIYIKRINP